MRKLWCLVAAAMMVVAGAAFPIAAGEPGTGGDSYQVFGGKGGKGKKGNKGKGKKGKGGKKGGKKGKKGQEV